MAALQGTILASKIVPTDSLDTYATHDDKYGRGGHRSVDTLEERDNITTPRRKEGMTVYVKSTKVKYVLEGGLTNEFWEAESTGGSSGGIVEFSSLSPEQREMIRGPQGPMGQRGLTGFKGDTGEQGFKGDIGPVGPPGSKGDKGDKGDQGLDGNVEFTSLTSNQLEMIRGLKGDKGDKGDIGERGPIGVPGTVSFEELTESQIAQLKGPKGDRGPAGDQGPQGPDGISGEKGDKGDTGQRGLQGLQGEKGEPGDVAFNELTPEQIEMITGDDAYKIALTQGFVGTRVEWLQSLIGEIKFETLTEDQKEQLLRSEVKYGMWGIIGTNITNFVITPGVTKLPIFKTKKVGNLVASTEDTFLLKKNRVYKIEVSFGFNSSNANYVRFGIYNNNTNSLISGINLMQPATYDSAHLLYESFISEYIRVDVDTPISVRMSNNNGALTDYTIAILAHANKINIMEISTREMILSDFSINGKKFDSNNNIDLEGLSTLSSPKLNVETLTEFRHSISGKPLYRKTINFGTLPNATNKFMAHGIVGAEDIRVNVDDSYAYYLQEQYPIVWTDTTATSQWRAWTDRTNVGMKTGFNATSIAAYITLLYTKITDTAESPVRLAGGRGESTYELWLEDGNSGTLSDFMESIKGQRGLPGPSGVDGTVSFESLTEAQFEMLLANRNIVTRKSVNLLLQNLTVNSCLLDINSKMSLPEKVEVTTNEDVIYTIENLRLANPLAVIGDCKYTNISTDLQFDIFADNNTLLAYPLQSNSNDLGGLYNGVDTGVTYANNKAVFNGAAKITPPAFTVPTEMTVSFYVTFTELGTFMLFDFGGGKAIYMYQDNRIRAQYSNAANANKSTTSAMVVGREYFVTAVIKAASADIYIDGELQINTPWANYVTSIGLCIGSKPNNEMRSKMNLSMLRVFKRALTASEILHMYQTRTKEILELYHASGVNLKDSKIIQQTVSLDIPRYLNEAEAIKYGLTTGDMYYLTDGSVKYVK